MKTSVEVTLSLFSERVTSERGRAPLSLKLPLPCEKGTHTAISKGAAGEGARGRILSEQTPSQAGRQDKSAEGKRVLKTLQFYLLQLEEQEQKGVRPRNDASEDSRGSRSRRVLGVSGQPLSLGLSRGRQTLATGPRPVGLGSAQAYPGFLLSPERICCFGVRHVVHLLNRTELDCTRVFTTKEREK